MKTLDERAESFLKSDEAAHMRQYGKIWTVVLIEDQAKEIADQKEQINTYQERLEIKHCFDADGNKVEIPEDERDDVPDGISCRDETIRQQDISIADQKETEAELREALEGCRDIIEYSFGWFSAKKDKRVLEWILSKGSIVQNVLSKHRKE